MNKEEQITGFFSKLNSVELSTIQKRYKGKTYKQIKIELEAEFRGQDVKIASESTLRKQFMTAGRLRDEYESYCSRINELAMKEAKIQFRSLIGRAVEVYREVMQDSGNPKALTAAKHVIESLWGRNPQWETEGDSNKPNQFELTLPELKEKLNSLKRELKLQKLRKEEKKDFNNNKN